MKGNQPKQTRRINALTRFVVLQPGGDWNPDFIEYRAYLHRKSDEYVSLLASTGKEHFMYDADKAERKAQFVDQHLEMVFGVKGKPAVKKANPKRVERPTKEAA